MSVLASGLTWLGGAAGGAIGGPAGTAVGAGVGSNLPGILTNWFGGSSRDARRQARCDWFTEQALAGSSLAARILIGGTQNTASNESPMYQKAIQLVQQRRPDVMTAGINAGVYWDTTDNDTADKMRAAVNAELAALNVTAVPTAPVWGGGSVPMTGTVPAPTSGGGGVSLTGAYPVAGLSPVVIVGALVALVVLFYVMRRS